MKRVQKIWGWEEIMTNEIGLYCGKILHVKKQGQCSMHYHKEKTETFFLLQGLIFMEVGKNIAYIMNPENTQLIKPEQLHRFTGLTVNSQIIEISTFHKDEDSYRKDKSKIVTIDYLKYVFDKYGAK